ncbi:MULTISPECIES: hypothetical protein [Bradyrhizobium]|uniref:hypothetical protein n=1 Tax=Bradyrhizobium TaxID=374 RepID=UPI0003FCC517|nr:MULTISPECIES: hypothetical protein [Bradyrhizobium]UFW52352.1 hypothetical protein BaraCB756_15750 [Bradyrhizobium arachidis]
MLTDHVELLRAAFREIRQSHPFTIAARSIFGNYPPDWAGDQASDGRDYGER